MSNAMFVWINRLSTGVERIICAPGLKWSNFHLLNLFINPNPDTKADNNESAVAKQAGISDFENVCETLS